MTDQRSELIVPGHYELYRKGFYPYVTCDTRIPANDGIQFAEYHWELWKPSRRIDPDNVFRARSIEQICNFLLNLVNAYKSIKPKHTILYDTILTSVHDIGELWHLIEGELVLDFTIRFNDHKEEHFKLRKVGVV